MSLLEWSLLGCGGNGDGGQGRRERVGDICPGETKECLWIERICDT